MKQLPVSEPLSITRVRLVYGKRAVNLLHGSYLIGRGPQCHVVIDDPRVSRLHARVIIDAAGPSIEDADSVNGIFVNGERITGRVQLANGDSVVIGNQELRFELASTGAPRAICDTLPEPETPGAPPRARSEPSGTPTEIPGEPGNEGFPPDESYSTARANALELLGGVAERALAAGDATQAEGVIRVRLLEVLDFVRASQPLDAEVSGRALRLALDLAHQLKAKHWLDFAIDLLTALAIPCSPDVVRQLRVARAAAGAPDPERLAAYARCVRALPMSLDKVRTVAMLAELTG
jgi:hypothetical protein